MDDTGTKPPSVTSALADAIAAAVREGEIEVMNALVAIVQRRAASSR